MPPQTYDQFVSRAASEGLLAAVAARTADPVKGVFGPESVSWKINRESAVFLGAGRAALLQLAHPWVAAALEEHSNLLHDPIARFHNTFRIVYAMIFGTLGQALAAARHLYTLHTRIEGEMREDAAGYSRGSRYRANETAALRWVYATLVESAVIAYEAALEPIAAEEREAYYVESKLLAALCGLDDSALPKNWGEFCEYNRGMAESDALGVSETARGIAHGILSGAGSWLRPPRWYRVLTATWLPERLRKEFGLSAEAQDWRIAEPALERVRWAYRRLPDSVRFVGPWHEARARLRGRRPGAAARLNNRFWIGEPRLPITPE
jgi:uncharacterized protein (DUF2236 family)